MKKWLGLLIALLLLPAVAPRASALDCPAASPQEKAARAQVIVYGVALPTESGKPKSHSINLKQVYKGEPKNPALVTRLEAYPLPEATDHTLYLTLNEKGFYDIDVCASHLGGPTPDEKAVLGDGRPAPEFQGASPYRFWVPVIAMVVGFGVVGLVLMTRKKDDQP